LNWGTRKKERGEGRGRSSDLDPSSQLSSGAAFELLLSFV